MTRRSGCLIAVLLITILFTLMILTRGPSTPPRPAPQPLTIERVQALGTLVTTRLTVGLEATVWAEGWLGEASVTWSGTGTLLIGPDLRQARLIEQDDARRTAVLLLPEPEVLDAYPQADGSGIRTELRGLWPLSPDERLLDGLQQQAIVRAHARIRRAASAADLTASRITTEETVKSFADRLGWKVRVQWQPPAARPRQRGRAAGGVVSL